MRARFLLPLSVLFTAVLAPLPATAEPAAPARSSAAPAPWVAPLGGELVVTRPFERPPTPFSAGHRGADLGGTPLSPVLAAGDGVVVFAGMVATVAGVISTGYSQPRHPQSTKETRNAIR